MLPAVLRRVRRCPSLPLLLACALLAAGSLGGDRTDRVSLSTEGLEADASSDYPDLSVNGRIVAFGSDATNLVPGDDNLAHDVFVNDRKSGETTRVSVASGGGQAGDSSYEPALSASGRWVAFSSFATDLVEGDANGDSDVFVRDRKLGVTTRASVASDGSEADGPSFTPALSASGRWVAFYSGAADLVDGDANGTVDVFVRDGKLGLTTRVSVATGGAEGDGASDWPSISRNGRWVAFESAATNLVEDDGSTTFDVFVHDRKTGETTRASLSSAGVEGNGNSVLPALSGNGRFVAFESLATNLVEGDTNGTRDIFVHDRTTGATTRVSVHSLGTQANASSGLPSISANGRWLAFSSSATNLVDGDGNVEEDVFVHDRKTGETRLASLSSADAQGDGDSFLPALAGKGRYVAFESEAADLVEGDGNLAADVLVRDLK
jgi:Tol biopolymer transport system component